MFKFLAVLIFAFSSRSLADVTLQFEVNKIHGLEVFVESLADHPNRPTSFKKLFESGPYNNEESRKMLTIFKQLYVPFSRGFDFDEYPHSRHLGFDVKDLILMQSAHSEDLSDFQTRIVGLMSMNDQQKFFSVLKYFLPIYEKLIWNSSVVELEKTKKLYEQKAKEWDLGSSFKKAKQFYRGVWPDELKFKLVLYPIPRGTQTAYSQSLGSFESIGVVIGDNHVEDRFGVIFHELCHSLYDSESDSTQRALEEVFKNSRSDFWQVGYNYFNEVMATSIGNGWFYSKIAKKVDSGSWYNDDKINVMAKSVFPMASEFMAKNRALDKEFVANYLSLFKQKFPQATEETQYLLSYVSLITDGNKVRVSDVAPDLQKIFETKSLESSSPLYVEKTIKQMKNGGAMPYFVVLDRSEIIQITESAKREPELFSGIEILKDSKGNGLFRFDNKDVPIVVALVSSPVDFSDFFQRVKKIKLIERGHWYPL